MAIIFNTDRVHRVVAANTHYYEQPTTPLYLDRTLEYHDFIYVENGQWLFTEETDDYLLEKDDVLLLSAGYHHYTRLPCLPGTRTVCIHVTCAPGDLEKGEGRLILPKLLHAGSNDEIKRLFHRIVDACWSDSALRQQKMSALINLLLYELAELRIGSAASEDHELASKIIALIDRNPHITYRVDDVAEKFNVSAKTVERAIKKKVDQTFSKYQTGRKLEMAAQQLSVEPDVKPAEIAQIFGFYDEFHFSRLFKAKYGVTPVKYRSGERDPEKCK